MLQGGGRGSATKSSGVVRRISQRLWEGVKCKFEADARARGYEDNRSKRETKNKNNKKDNLAT